MRIHDANASAISGLKPEQIESGQTSASSKKTEARGGGDQVQLSSLSSLLVNVLGSETSDRSGRLARLAMEVKTGKYQPDAVAVSRSLVAESLAQGA